VPRPRLASGLVTTAPILKPASTRAFSVIRLKSLSFNSYFFAIFIQRFRPFVRGLSAKEGGAVMTLFQDSKLD